MNLQIFEFQPYYDRFGTSVWNAAIAKLGWESERASVAAARVRAWVSEMRNTHRKLWSS